jgi:nitrogen fixation/metabolism regulation signal transduction histidine kinase
VESFGGVKMQGSLQKQPRIRILPALRVSERIELREANIDDAVKTIQGALLQHVDGDIDVTITLLEKNLKIMTDMALMKETMTQLVRDAIPDCGKFPLTINQVHFEIESLLNSNDSIIGACAFISFAAAGRYIRFDEKIKMKILEPFFTTETDGSGLSLAIAYRIIKQHLGRTKVKSQAGQCKEANIYLPLTRLEMVSMMSIPTE